MPANCSSSKDPAFFREGTIWTRDWLMLLSDSPIPSFAPRDMLFSFDSTVTWAVYAMTTGLGSAVSKGGNIRFFMDTLPCMPSLEVITEVLENIMSEMKGFARYRGEPPKVNENDLIKVSSTYAMERDGSRITLIEPRKIGSSLLLSAFVVIQLLEISIVIFLLIAYYEPLWNRVKTNSHNAHSIYRSVVFLSAGFLILRMGVFVFALLRGSQFALSNQTVLVAFSLSTAFALASLVIEMVVAFIVIVNGKSGKNDDGKTNICGIVQQLCSLFVLFAFLQNIAAAAIPISVLLAMYPGEVISTLALISSCIACIIVFTAHIFHLDSPKRNRRNGSSRTCRSALKVVSQAVALVLFIVLFGIVFVVYLLLLSKGLDDAGLVGFVVSLIPSMILSYAAKLVGKKLLKEQAQDETQL